MAPAKTSRNSFRVSSGSRQLFVGPASSLVREQMNVNSSTRATSAGSERKTMLPGRFFSSSAIAVPDCTSCRSMSWYSEADPSHHATRSGRHSARTSSTHASSLLLVVMASPVGLLYPVRPSRGRRERWIQNERKQSSPRAPEPQQTRSEPLSPLHGSNAVPRTLDWQHLLPDGRTGSSSEPTSAARSPFQRDHDRILFSGPFRRLADKTQVFPLPVDDHVHSRLTHSLEVATIGRSLGTLVGRTLIAQGAALPAGRDARDVGDCVAAACLAHDLGNPPFGHIGEAAIQEYFEKLAP